MRNHTVDFTRPAQTILGRIYLIDYPIIVEKQLVDEMETMFAEYKTCRNHEFFRVLNAVLRNELDYETSIQRLNTVYKNVPVTTRFLNITQDFFRRILQ